VKAKAIIAIMDFDELSEERQWEFRRKHASELFHAYRRGGLFSERLERKIKSIVDGDDVLIPITEQIAHLNEVKENCQGSYYTGTGTRIHPLDVEYII